MPKFDDRLSQGRAQPKQKLRETRIHKRNKDYISAGACDTGIPTAIVA